MSVLEIPRAIFDDLRAHGEETYPMECCGALLGHATTDGWRVVKNLRATNARGGAGRHHYEIAPEELAKIVREARSKGLEIVGFYHSHPDRAAEWSATDLEEAHWLGCSYVITEIAQGRAKATKAFLLTGEREEDKRFEAQILSVIE
jgi:proteasome lid subunit RPN8/RPN11